MTQNRDATAGEPVAARYVDDLDAVELCGHPLDNQGCYLAPGHSGDHKASPLCPSYFPKAQFVWRQRS